MSVFVTADTHFGHRMMAYHRGYNGDPHTMNECMIGLWNITVGKDDEVIHLGDFSFCGAKRTLEILSRLRGRITLVPGNHDAPSMLRHLAAAGVTVVEPLIRRRLWEDRPRATLCHYPLLTWPTAHHGAWHLHGHSHGNLKTQLTTRIDVGWDVWHVPVNTDELRQHFARLQYAAVDHHESKEQEHEK